MLGKKKSIKKKINRHNNPYCLMLMYLHPVPPIASISQDPDRPIPSAVRASASFGQTPRPRSTATPLTLCTLFFQPLTFVSMLPSSHLNLLFFYTVLPPQLDKRRSLPFFVFFFLKIFVSLLIQLFAVHVGDWCVLGWTVDPHSPPCVCV